MADSCRDLENKCETLMIHVVESRKRCGKMCADYEQKTSLIENKILNLQIENVSSYSYKKNAIPSIDNKHEQYLEEFSLEMLQHTKRIEDLKKKIQNTKEVVSQLKSDGVGKRLREPLTAEVLLAKAKNK